MGHCGNWEMMNLMARKVKYDLYAVYKPLNSKVINRLMIALRSRFGMKLVSDRSVVRHFLSHRSTSAIYLFLTDQCPQITDDKYKFKFLNQDTYIFSGMEKLARANNAAVVYLNVKQSSKGYYRVKFIPICSGSVIFF